MFGLVTKKLNLFFILFSSFLIYSLFGLIGCSSEGPPGEIISKAKNRTVAIIDSVRMTDSTLVKEPELVKEYYDKKDQRYVLKYYLETRFGSPVTNSPEAYIKKEDNKWIYTFQFGTRHREEL